jgi:hypothetical protein
MFSGSTRRDWIKTKLDTNLFYNLKFKLFNSFCGLKVYSTSEVFFARSLSIASGSTGFDLNRLHELQGSLLLPNESVRALPAS